MMMMMFGRFSSIAVSRARNVSTSATVINVISKHIEDLSKKSDLILETRRNLGGAKILRNPLQRELLQSQPRLVNQLDFLKKLYREIVPAATTHPHSALSIVSKQLHDLHRKLALITKVEDQLNCQGVSINEDRTNVIASKSFVVHHFIVLKKVWEEIAYEIGLHSPGGEVFENGLKNNETVELEPLDNKHRNLLLSNGCEIYCLDLKQSRHQSVTRDIPFLPTIASLNLLDENLPTTVGLFKWRSHAFMIGGQELQQQALRVGLAGIKLYRYVCEWKEVKPTSCLIQRLSLDDSNTSLSHSESDILKLKKPKIWPIVEEINGEIHVIDCLPDELVCSRSLEWKGSHEVLNRDNGCWVKEVPIPTGDTAFHIRSYLVVADRIYARSTSEYLVFDSGRNKWHVSSRTRDHRNSHYQLASAVGWEDNDKPRPRPLFKDVWDVLDNCMVLSGVGGFPFGDVEDPLCVVIVQENSTSSNDRVHLVAFLVNSSGQILCIQTLKHFFKWSLCEFYKGRIIKVEEEDKLGKKTMCSIVTGSELEWTDSDTHLNKVLISTFSVDELPDAAEKVRQVLGKGRLAWPVEMEFVRVDVMDKLVYKTDEGFGGGGELRHWVKVQACFL